MEENIKVTFDDSEVVAKLDALEKQIVEIGKASEKTGDVVATSMKEAATATQQFDAALDNAAQETARQVKAVDQAQKANQSWAASIKQTIAGQQVAGRSLGEWAEQARTFAARIADGTGATTKATAAWRIFSNVLKVTGIGVLIAAIGSLISYLSKFQPLLDRVSQITAGFGAVVDVVAKRVIALGGAFVKLFSGDFSGAWEDAGNAVSGFGDELVSAALAAADLEKRIQSLRDTIIRNSVINAQEARDLAKIEAALGNVNLTIQERMKLEKEAGDLRQSQAQRDFEAAKLDLANKQEAADRAEDNLDLQKEAAAAQVAFLEAQSRVFKEEADAVNKQRELRKQASDERKKQQEEELKRAEQLRKEYEKLFADVQRQAEALNIENTFNPLERVIKQYQAALDETEKLRAKLLVLAPTDAEKAKVNEAIETLFDEIAIKYREELNKAEDELNELRGGKIREALNPLPPLTTLKRDVTDLLAGLKQSADEFIAGQQPRSLAEILGISDEGLEGLKEAGKQVIDSLQQIADARVKAAEETTRAREKDLQEAQDFLIKQQELAAQGLANDTDLAKAEVARQKELRDAALKEEAKARRSQILLDSAGQISALITASANIFKSLSAIPFAGVPLAIATIATMFGAFAKAKADALKSASVPKFRKGTRLEGRSHEAGGLAISDEHGNVVGEAEGDEWLIGTKPSREHDRFLERLNKGEFAGVDLDRLFRSGTSNPLTEAAPRIERIEREFREIRETQHTAALTTAYQIAAREIVQAIEGIPEISPLTNYRRTQRKGSNVEIKVVREEK